MTETLVRPTTNDTLVVIVTLDDIRQGVQGNYYQCAIARSLRRMGADDACVAGNVLAFGRRWELTPEAGRWIRTFDRCRAQVTPERFVLRLEED